MSLFATDASLLSMVGECEAPDSHVGEPAEALAELLPIAVHDALSRGHVRSAAMLFEQAMELLSLEHPAMQGARQALDACAADDAAKQQRLLAGELVILPSLTERRPGVPRFDFGVMETELAHPVVYAFLQAERTVGADAELRNFLDEAMLAHDTLVDLDPGAGAAMLSAMTLTDGTLVASQPDPMLSVVLTRNATALAATLGSATLPTVVDTLDDACLQVQDRRTIVHLGRMPVAAIAPWLRAWQAYPVAIAWDASDDAQAPHTSAELETAGLPSFLLIDEDGAMALRPYAAGHGATMAFALSDRFIDSLAGDDAHV
jgi:hypothetical protein